VPVKKQSSPSVGQAVVEQTKQSLEEIRSSENQPLGQCESERAQLQTEGSEVSVVFERSAVLSIRESPDESSFIGSPMVVDAELGEWNVTGHLEPRARRRRGFSSSRNSSMDPGSGRAKRASSASSTPRANAIRTNVSVELRPVFSNRCRLRRATSARFPSSACVRFFWSRSSRALEAICWSTSSGDFRVRRAITGVL